MFKHVIWDFDGTLFDTYPVMAKIFKDLLEKEGIEEPLDEIMQHMQVSLSAAVAYYEKKYAVSSEFIKEFKILQKTKGIESAKPFKDIEEICKYIHSTNRKNYLYTHRGSSALTLLKNHNLDNYFSDFITFDQRFERKPNADALNYLIKEHAMHPEEALMIGDREIDLLAAKNAGISACYFNEKKQGNEHADYVVDNFKHLYSII
ncbi:HAD-IA family hydrolase [Carnobacterium inhibens]|uniref:Phosphoglycolate phosphatase n=1 Tax=Carnobacterium inhibens subsp. gilichinskyi TaxID=1266845 RepID=U5SB27_9LACT|nr:HAD-IA family hydrolase [Carnobacterium inhibens]AGY82494.1 phosphoglycolate phosphatase [Carnobacterium inhibens subsp. gilichinskyi]